MKKTIITLLALCLAYPAFAATATTCTCAEGDALCSSACARAKVTAAKKSVK